MPIIDTHLHLLQPSRFHYHWLQPGSALDRDFSLHDIHEEMRALNVIGGILIEATNTPEEIAWLLETCENEPFCKGVIGWIDLEKANAAAQIDRFTQSPYFKGIRLNWLEARPDSRQLDAAMHSLHQHRLVVDVLARFEQLPEMMAFMRCFPGVTFVLDHFAGMALDETGLETWGVALQSLATLPNIVIKVSGYSVPVVSTLRAYIHEALSKVGAERLMFGSNWPMFQQTCSYMATIQFAWAAIAYVDNATRAALFHDTALKIYRLEMGS